MRSGGRNLKRPTRGRDAFWFYMIVALVFLSLEVFTPSLPGRIRAVASDTVAPILIFLAEPIRAIQSGVERIVGVSDIYVENENLRTENERLKQWRVAAQRLLLENQRLRQILNAPNREVPTLVTARVVGLGGGAFERSVLVDAGRREGMLENLPVVDEVGLVGRTIEVGYFSARLLLITDLNSRVPVRIERTGDVAIAEGLNEPFMQLRFLPAGSSVQIGDRLITSGHGGVFPADVPVAVVSEIIDERVYLTPVSQMDTLDFVRILNYQPLPPEAEPDAQPNDAEAPLEETGGIGTGEGR